MTFPLPELPEPSRRKFYRATKVRSYRLERGVLLSEAARSAAPPFSLVRASVLERFPEKARAGELERLLRGVDRVAGAGRRNERSTR